ncbi:SRPBCC family protein [Halomonas sp. hl-4]|uniref:SRPBCC family protein n=1 Tax=Halomonas sp. hl-4 TaxID=1761789 RepID=UPI000BB9A760|nr:SRPBCC family protein [Halomonas sp. hl-4]SNY97608.1 Uncharacterized conserved protein YndB, AHSA1/START domain [Halomonas sp. hl-4]
MKSDNFKLTISRIIKAPPSIVWKAWTEKEHFEQWWIPEPIKCKVVQMDMTPGGGFETLMSENGKDFQPHVEGCFLQIVPRERIVFTTVLTEGWKPHEPWLSMTAIITLEDVGGSTKYTAQALHKNPEDNNKHLEMGFEEGWGATIDQLEKLAMKLA